VDATAVYYFYIPEPFQWLGISNWGQGTGSPTDSQLIIMLLMKLISNNKGYVLDSLDNNNNHVILFGRRDIQTITNMLHANYMFTSDMSLESEV